MVSSHRPASLSQHARAGRERRQFPSIDRTTQGTPFCSKLLVRGRSKSEHGNRCGASPEHRSEETAHGHVACALQGHIRSRPIIPGNAAPPDKGPCALRGVGPVVLPMVRKAIEVHRRRGHVADVPSHCVCGCDYWPPVQGTRDRNVYSSLDVWKNMTGAPTTERSW